MSPPRSSRRKLEGQEDEGVISFSHSYFRYSSISPRRPTFNFSTIGLYDEDDRQEANDDQSPFRGPKKEKRPPTMMSHITIHSEEDPRLPTDSEDYASSSSATRSNGLSSSGEGTTNSSILSADSEVIPATIAEDPQGEEVDTCDTCVTSSPRSSSKEPLCQLVYTSSASDRYVDRSGLEDILKSARKNNALNGVTGLLLFRDGSFVQFLEGPVEAVEEIFDRIQEDDRHRGVIVVLRRPIEHRDFRDWKMGFRDMTEPLERENMDEDLGQVGGKVMDQELMDGYLDLSACRPAE